MATSNSRITIVNEEDDSKVSVTNRGLKGALGVELLDSSGNQVVTFGDEKYFVSDKDDNSSPSYYGFIDKDGNWYIMQEAVSAGIDTYRYIKGTSGYVTSWSDRTSLTYDYYNNIF